MKLFAHRKLSEKIGWSFAGLIMLIALTAGVALLTAYLAYWQIDRQQETATILSDINRVNSALSRYGKDSSRDSAMDIFHNLDRVRQQTRHPAGASAEISSLFPLIDDFRLQFQKFVAEADQKAALESQMDVLQQRINTGLKSVLPQHGGLGSHTAYEDLIGHVVDLQWLRQDVGSGTPLTEAIRQHTRHTQELLRQAVLNDVRDNAMQRRLYRILHDAGDFLKTLEKYSDLDESCRRTTEILNSLSKELEASTAVFALTGQEATRRQISHALALMAGLFVASTIGAAILSRRLTSEILRPIHGLLATTGAAGMWQKPCPSVSVRSAPQRRGHR